MGGGRLVALLVLRGVGLAEEPVALDNAIHGSVGVAKFGGQIRGGEGAAARMARAVAIFILFGVMVCG